MQRKAAALAVSIVAASAAAFAGLSLQQDFAAYYVAGQARRAGFDPYVNHVDPSPWTAPGLWDGVAPFRHSRFLYPPLVAELCRPLAALPYAAGKALFTVLAVAAWLAAAHIAGGGPTLLVAGALYFPLYLHLERGQIDVFVLPLLLLAWRRRDQAAVAGAALALAGLLKPAAFGLLPVLAALRHARVAVAAAIGSAILAAGAIAVSGPALAQGYVTEVLPRAMLYGEGGTEAMLLPEARFPTVRADRYRASLWDGPASASLPRLLAPESPTRGTAVAPYLLGMLALMWAARRVSSHASSTSANTREELVYWAAAVGCVITSPSGWAMGMVWALPIAPLVLKLRTDGELSRRTTFGFSAAWIACAVPAPFAGFPALAGAALVVTTVAIATTVGPR